jgi:excisionase family DNA binding protein
MNFSETSELMTLEEISAYLRLSEKTILRMIQKNEIPCIKIASQWRFKRKAIEDWLNQKMKKEIIDPLSTFIETNNSNVPVSRLVDRKLIKLDIEPGSKEAVLRQLIAPAEKAGLIKNSSIYLAKLMEREAMSSTAISRGFAFPHIRRPEENIQPRPALVIGRCSRGTDFNSHDGQKTFIFFLLISRSEVVHLRNC